MLEQRGAHARTESQYLPSVVEESLDSASIGGESHLSISDQIKVKKSEFKEGTVTKVHRTKPVKKSSLEIKNAIASLVPISLNIKLDSAIVKALEKNLGTPTPELSKRQDKPAVFFSSE